MGANENYEAAMHGYVPDEKQLRNAYLNVFTGERNETSNAEFDRGIAKVRAEAKAEAWDECANHISDVDDFAPPRLAGELKRANPYKEQS